jgi:HNH endonuclease/AP2 domain
MAFRQPRHEIIQLTGPLRLLALTQGKTAVVSVEDFEQCKGYSWRAWWNKCTRSFYAIAYIGGKQVYLHRFVMGAPKGMDVDHKNHDTLDCTRPNLRICTRSENLQNCRKRSSCSSSYKGVYWSKKGRQWVARVEKDDGSGWLGGFSSEAEAARAYNAAALLQYGEFALLNAV